MDIFTAGASAVGAIAAIAAVVISWLVYRHQRGVHAPGARAKAEFRENDGGSVFGVEVCLDPPGSPPRGIREVRVRAPKGAEVSRWRGRGAAWGDRVLYDLADAEAELFVRVDSPERQVLHLRVRTGRWSWVEAACEIADWMLIAERNIHR